MTLDERSTKATVTEPQIMVPGNTVPRAFQLEGMKAAERAGVYRDLSVCWVMPMRDRNVDIRVAGSWLRLWWPPNQFTSGLLPEIGKEVGEAYNLLFRRAIDKDFAKTHIPADYIEHYVGARFVLASEYDNVLPPKAVMWLLESIYTCPDCGGEVGARVKETGEVRLQGWDASDEWTCEAGHRGLDAVAGLYSKKQWPPEYMAYGDPKSNRNDFTPRAMYKHIEQGGLVEVNGIPMGCTLFRKGIFPKVSDPWFKTVPKKFTQDIWFCDKAIKEANARFAVDCRVTVGHLDAVSGVMY